MSYLINLIDALSRLLNAILGGQSGETLSAHAYRKRERKRWWLTMRLIDALVFWQDSHCFEAYKYHKLGGGLPSEYQ